MAWYKNRAGINLWYEDIGTGRPIFFIHGWCLSSAIWKYQFANFTDSFRLIAADLAGHGSSKATSEQLTFDSFANDLCDLIELLDLNNITLIGWSMGGEIALRLISKVTDRVSKLVLVSTTPRFTASDDFSFAVTKKSAEGMRQKIQRSISRALKGFKAEMFANDEITDFEITDLLSAIPSPDITTATAALDSLITEDLRYILPEIAIPTMIINGSEDKICLPEASSYMKDCIKNAKLVEFRNCGHAPFLTHYKLFNKELLEFL